MATTQEADPPYQRDWGATAFKLCRRVERSLAGCSSRSNDLVGWLSWAMISRQYRSTLQSSKKCCLLAQQSPTFFASLLDTAFRFTICSLDGLWPGSGIFFSVSEIFQEYISNVLKYFINISRNIWIFVSLLNFCFLYLIFCFLYLTFWFLYLTFCFLYLIFCFLYLTFCFLYLTFCFLYLTFCFLYLTFFFKYFLYFSKYSLETFDISEIFFDT